MSEKTKNLGLFKYDTTTDGKQVFSIDKGMNDNWDKIDANTLNHNQITNCLLEVPQRIKLELNNGKVTLKAGSIVVFPYGTEDKTAQYPIGSKFGSSNNLTVWHTSYNADGQFSTNRFFIYVQTQNDILLEQAGTATVDVSYFYVTVNGDIGFHGFPTTYAQTTMPTSGQLWFDLSNNIFIATNDQFSTYDTCTISLPIATFARTSGTITKIHQIFNGIGYIGSFVWVDKDVKFLVADGRNEDGTLRNKCVTVDKLTIRNNPNKQATIWWRLGLATNNTCQLIDMTKSNNYYEQEDEPSTTYTIWYKPSENIVRYTGATANSFYILPMFRCIECQADSLGRMTYFKPNFPVTMQQQNTLQITYWE